MKKIVLCSLILLFLFYCSSQKTKVDKKIEDGVEIILNHIEPYPIKGEPSVLKLEKELSIDFASLWIGHMGIADAVDFEVDSEGSIYFFVRHGGNLIFKFDKQGNFIKSFGQKGQGPGEIQYIVWTGLDDQDNLFVSDNGNRKILFFTNEGEFIKDIRYPPNVGLLYPLSNGNYFGLWNNQPRHGAYKWAFSLYDSEFKEIKLLDSQNVYSLDIEGMRGIVSKPFTANNITKKNIYLVCEDRGYELLKYDLEGNLVQKICKKYEPIEVSDQVIQERKEQYEKYGMKIWFPEFWPPIGDFFLDDDGRIFVMTFEIGKNPKEHIFDIFNPEGVFIGKTSLNVLTLGDANICAKSRNSRFYCFQEKPDGFREFQVYQISWGYP